MNLSMETTNDLAATIAASKNNRGFVRTVWELVRDEEVEIQFDALGAGLVRVQIKADQTHPLTMAVKQAVTEHGGTIVAETESAGFQSNFTFKA